MYAPTSQSLGSTIRQLRRQQSLTQTELGGELFSKSYVSAVERNKIVPSYEAMRFFAEQLEQPRDYFENIFHQQEQMNAQNDAHEGELVAALESQLSHLHVSNSESTMLQENFLLLLDTVMAHAELYSYTSHHFDLPEHITQLVSVLPAPFQGRFSFLRGLQEMQHGNTDASISALEHALALAPNDHQPTILDALGTNYYNEKEHHIALNYHRRALRLLDEQRAATNNDDTMVSTQSDGATINANSTNTTNNGRNNHQDHKEAPFPHLRLYVNLHCGNDCSALGAHQQAIDYYEQAYQLLSPLIDIETVGQLLLNLVYSTYAYLYQHLDTTSQDVVDSSFQRAISFLVQSRMVYQAGGDAKKESEARLTQALILLDMSNWRRKLAQQQLEPADKTASLNVNYLSLLDDAVEQCRQVILRWLSSYEHISSSPNAEIEVHLYSAMAYSIRAFIYRSVAAQLGGYNNTQTREISIAIHYCQQLLNSLSEETFPWTLAYEFTSQQQGRVRYEAQPLPKIPANSSTRHPLSLTPTYFAAAVLLETLGRNATNANYAEDAYKRSDECIQRALVNIQKAYQEKLVDISYVVRYYQYCTELLEEREAVAEEQGIQIDGTLRKVLKDGLQKLTLPLL